jgi:hypothetical protein
LLAVLAVAATASLASVLVLTSGCRNRSEPSHEGSPNGGVDALEYRDNQDGTVTDLSTGLVWEKKCDCQDSPHHFGGLYLWSGDGEHETIWDWIASLNREGGRGYAGHDDWRIPNVKELATLLDYERTDPAIRAPFDACADACADPVGQDCGCTASGAYWTSTTFADFPAHALLVNFGNGGVEDKLKTRRGFARAVRGPIVDPGGGEPDPRPSADVEP